MKKVFAILAVAGFMAACNSGENKEATTDSAATETVAPATTDSSAATTDSSAAATTDSSAAAPAAH
ncbi:hypothetical protein KACHI17_09590 [Sediminibacterium sp. KACHI17]|jgi:hypothetical protein|uniref:Entericidin n=1 Tax=Sediminibacterium sp. KACHI17 TaxID=1751071 RepID=A0AAT9GHU3_9BACT